MTSDTRISRRNALKAGAALAAATAAADGFSGTALADDVRRFDGRQAIDPKGRVLLKGGTIVSMDAKVGDLVKGDLLIEGTKISAIAPEINAADAQVIDAVDTIIVPGLVDCHRHSWEGAAAPHQSEFADACGLYERHASVVRQVLSAAGSLCRQLPHRLGCIDAGVTCVIDNSHNSRSAAHSDAAVEALFDSGIRAVHASGQPGAGDWDHQWPQDLERLQEEIFLLGRPARDVAHVLRPRSARTGRSRASSGFASPPNSKVRSRRRCSIRWRPTSWSARTTPSTIAARCRSGPGRFFSTAAPTSTSARARTRNMRSAKASARFQQAWTTASSRASASTTKPPTRPTCSWRCGSRSTSSARWRRTANSPAIKIRPSR